ncbi:MAG: M1 family metallopeptidase [Chloroflexi bacterium]|nr:M1 family metallopeptidase [Chloroflexota bacterium]
MPTSEAIVLPATVRPVKYRIKLQPDLDRFTFQGDESIDIHVVEATREIVLNALDLEIASATLHCGGSENTAESITFDEERQTATLSFGQQIPIGDATLDISFTGELNDKLHGFYRSEYTTPEGEQKYLAATQFEATDARRAFPCWDEPAQKAIFEVTLVVPDNLQAVSNTPVVEETMLTGGLKSVRYAETPVMSTYLLVFVVGELVYIHEKATNDTTVGIWTTRGKEDQGRFALDTSVKLLSFFNDYFGIPYPLEKLDHIAIPDFAAGAMENWGAITYRETALLVDEHNSSAGTRQRVAEVVAHEMAHMWFGDLVTMEWWEDLWLNESFASWMGTKAVDWLFPEWQMWTQFVNMDTARALSLDGLKNSHPIEQEVKDPAEVSQLFDAISYSKGASVIRMLEQFLGPETFRQGLSRYLTAHQYGNARTEDLWSALAEASGQPVTSIMDTWTKQIGYPVLSVESDRVAGRLDLRFHQERFVYDRLLEAGEPEPQVWQVPVGVSLQETSGGESEATRIVMDSRQASLSLTPPKAGFSESQWFKVNPGQTGFFRVNYSADDWERLVPAIRALELPATDRLGIQNDAYALSRAGLLPVTQFLSLARAYENEDDASVWSDLASNLRDVETLLADGPVHGPFQSFGRQIFRPAAMRIGWEARPGEGHLDALLRSTVLSQAGNYQDPEVLDQAKSRFQRYLQDPESVHPDIRGLVFSLAGQTGDEATYGQLWELEKKATLQEEKIRLLMALTRFTQPELLRETLERSLSSDVRSQDTISVVSGVAANLDGRDLAWEFVKDQWPEFDRRYGGGGFGLMRLVSICSHFTTQEQLADVEAFFQEHPIPAAQRTILQSLERVRLNIKWLEQNGQELADWFRG